MESILDNRGVVKLRCRNSSSRPHGHEACRARGSDPSVNARANRSDQWALNWAN